MGKTTIVQGDIIEVTGGNNVTYSREGIENSADRVMQVGKENGVTHGDPTIYETIENLKGVKVTASIFFDGTKNNRNNTFRRLDKDKNTKTSAESKAIYKQTYEKESSYENGYSNIAILQMMSTKDKDNRIVSKYIEGEGTEDDQKGDSTGFGFGTGTTGIPVKVNKGFKAIKKEINSVFIPTEEYVRELTINVFGFSRGAAAARSFVTTTKNKFKVSYPKAKITYSFVGLFDTVSSYEPEGKFGLAGLALSHNFNNDVTELGLKLNGIAKKVIHLTAENEYRKNFSLTTIDSDIAAGVGYELQLPGAHSDIGGGYEDYPHMEQRYISRDGSPSKREYINGGWYTDAQIEGQHSVADPVNFIGTRKLTNSYQFIPLSIMMSFAKKYGVSFKDFADEKEYKNYKVISELQSTRQDLESFALQNEAAISTSATIKSMEVLKNVRNKYLHISTNPYSTGMEANYENGKIHRFVIKDNI